MADDRSDEELYAAWVEGDRAAADDLIGRHLGRVGRFFANKVANASDAEDLACKAFEICARKLGSFQQTSRFQTYLFGIARNVLRDYIKHKLRGAREVDFNVTAIRDLDPSPSTLLGRRKEQALLLSGLRAIPLDCQIVIELSFFEDMTQAEIADLLHVPAGTVASRLRRGKRLLDERMEALADSPEALQSTRHGMRRWAQQLRDQLPAGERSDEPS